jgi:hypothetical protein
MAHPFISFLLTIRFITSKQSEARAELELTRMAGEQYSKDILEDFHIITLSGLD